MRNSTEQQAPKRTHFQFQMWDKYLNILNTTWNLDPPSLSGSEEEVSERSAGDEQPLSWSQQVHNLNQTWHIPPTLELPAPSSFMGKLLFPLKKFILRSIQPAIDKMMMQQNEFNAKIVQTFNSLEAQRQFNSRIVTTLNGLVELSNSELERLRDEVSQHLQHFQSQFDAFQSQFDTFQSQFDAFQSHLDTLQSHIDNRLEQIEPHLDAFELMIWTFDRRKEALEIEQILLSQKLQHLLAIIRPETPHLSESQIRELPAPERQQDYEYFVFENLHRGDERAIKQRMEEYVRYFKSCSHVLDIGCARGEFLELLKEHDIEGYGIDPNQLMVQYCQKKGLPVEEADALSHLNSLSDDSLDGIFVAHLVEHFTLHDLQRLLQQCFEKLSHHKYFIIETPNPRSLYTLSQHFYKDLSHDKPLHPDALQYLVKAAGFQEVRIEYKNPFSPEKSLQELDVTGISDETLRSQMGKINRNIRQLNELVFGSLDYAIIAKKVNML